MNIFIRVSSSGFQELFITVLLKWTSLGSKDYGEDLRKAICYVNGGGAIASLGDSRDVGPS